MLKLRAFLQYPVLPNHVMEYQKNLAVRNGGYLCHFSYRKGVEIDLFLPKSRSSVALQFLRP
jgi:hypothetical protein